VDRDALARESRLRERRDEAAVPDVPVGDRDRTSAARQRSERPAAQRTEKAPKRGGPFLGSSTFAQPTLRVKMLAWSAPLEIAKNGKKLVPSVPSPS
jgi:hypothetical protein